MGPYLVQDPGTPAPEHNMGTRRKHSILILSLFLSTISRKEEHSSLSMCHPRGLIEGNIRFGCIVSRQLGNTGTIPSERRRFANATVEVYRIGTNPIARVGISQLALYRNASVHALCNAFPPIQPCLHGGRPPGTVPRKRPKFAGSLLRSVLSLSWLRSSA